MNEATLILLAVAIVGIAYLAMAGFMIRRLAGGRLAGHRPAVTRATPSVTILKPLHGSEPHLLRNLLSFARQDYAGPLQIVFGVQRTDDPAMAVVREVQAACPDRRIDLVVDARLHGTNRKVSNLINMLEVARHDVIVLADSDMQVGPDYLSSLVAELDAPGIGAVSCPYHGLPDANVWARLAGLSIDTHFLPGVAVGVGLNVAHPCMGSTIALRRETLERIGGFVSLTNELADDHMLGVRVRALGLGVIVTPFAIGHVCPERSAEALVAQELRWLRTVRQVAPAGHLGSVITHPAAFATLALALDPGLPTAAVLAAALAARLGLCLVVERSFGLKARPYGLIPIRDLLSFALFAASFFGRGVSWRGYRYEAAPGGALLSKARPDPL